jgi:hypothetical protein
MHVPKPTQFGSQSRNRRKIGPIEPTRALAAHPHQAAFQQDRQMLRHGRTGNGKFCGNLACRALIAPDQRQDLPPPPVGHGAQHRVHARNVREFESSYVRVNLQLEAGDDDAAGIGVAVHARDDAMTSAGYSANRLCPIVRPAMTTTSPKGGFAKRNPPSAAPRRNTLC